MHLDPNILFFFLHFFTLSITGSTIIIKHNLIKCGGGISVIFSMKFQQNVHQRAHLSPLSLALG